MREIYRGYELLSLPLPLPGGRWSVGVRISRLTDPDHHSHASNTGPGRVFREDKKIAFLLEQEAAKEGLNLGRNLVDRGMV